MNLPTSALSSFTLLLLPVAAQLVPPIAATVGDAGAPARAAPEARDPRLERWIVTFETPTVRTATLQAAIRGHAPAATVDAIVRDLEAQAVARDGALTRAVAGLGGRATQHFWILDACAVEVPGDRVDALRALPDVAGVFRDSLRAAANFELIKDATNLRNHNSDLANQQGFRGAGVTVAIADSGCDVDMGGAGRPHATFFVNGDINNRTGGGIGGSRLLINRQMGSQSADDIIAHGTAVAACAAGQIWSTPNGDPGQAPDAKVAGYGMADTTNGAALLTTIIATWQQIAIDAVPLGIKVANISYQGTSYVEWPEQRAMDTAAQVADLAIAVMGGNDPHYAHAALNVLAVGSVTTDSRVLSVFSAHGPLETDQLRFIPDLVANGDSLKMPQADNETVDRVASGTSYASPQVAGAMALFRGIRPTATSLETRAAVLASAEPIGDQNRLPANHNRNAYGLGYLRSDRLAALASAPGTLSTTRILTPQQPNLRVQFPVVANQWYVAALAWNRQNAMNMTWSNLDLSVSLNGAALGSSTTPRNVHERVVFRPRSSGVVDVDVTGVSLEPGEGAVAIGLVVAASASPAYVEGRFATFGSSCGPVLTPVTIASIGTSYELQVGTPFGTTGALMYGVSNQTWSGLTLPLALGGFGAPGCLLLVSPDLIQPVTVGSTVARIFTPLPNDPALLGAHLFHQAALLSTANRLGAVFSGGVDQQIAGFRQ